MAEPGPGKALGLGDLAGGHLLGDLGAAILAFLAAGKRGEIEPLMRFDQVDADAAGSAAERNAKIISRLRIAPCGIAHAALEQKTGTLQTVRHHNNPL